MSGSTNNVIGSGSDIITLKLSGDQTQGVDAQFTINVDGKQIGGLQSVSASHAAGQDETFTFAGNYGPGKHDIVVTFANNFLLPGTPGDRNLYVDNVNYDGTTISDTTAPLYEGPFFAPNNPNGTHYGNSVYSVDDTTAIPADAPSTPTTTPAPVSAGSGPDTLVLNMSEDPFQGDAQFTVSVDGKPVGGTLTTTAITNQGQQQEFDLHGSFGGGSHTVSIDFTNDHIGAFYPGTQLAVDTTDRNLYVMGVSLNGGPAAAGAPWEEGEGGPHSFTVTAGSNPSSVGTPPIQTTSDVATITAGSLAAGGSSSGISFAAAPASTPAATDTTASTSGTASSTSTAAAAAPPVASVVADTTPTVADFTGASASGSSGTATTTPSSGSHHHHHWQGHDHGHWAALAHHQG